MITGRAMASNILFFKTRILIPLSKNNIMAKSQLAAFGQQVAGAFFLFFFQLVSFSENQMVGVPLESLALAGKAGRSGDTNYWLYELP